MLSTIELHRRWGKYIDDKLKEFDNEEIGEDTDIMDFEDFEAMYITAMDY